MHVSDDDWMEMHLATKPIKEIFVLSIFFSQSALSAWNKRFHN